MGCGSYSRSACVQPGDAVQRQSPIQYCQNLQKGPIEKQPTPQNAEPRGAEYSNCSDHDPDDPDASHLHSQHKGIEKWGMPLECAELATGTVLATRVPRYRVHE